MPEKIDRREGRHLFGLNPQGYEASRPEYPGWIYECLRDSGALRAGTATLEIGAGTGRATRKLLEYGADPMTIVEPDARFAEMLQSILGELTHCRVIHRSFEDAELDADQFDLVAAATSFHWIAPEVGLAKVRRVLRDGGVAALFWNTLADLAKQDAFHDATEFLLSGLAAAPSGAPNTLPHALDRVAREADAREAGFERVQYFESKWEIELSTEQIGALYEGFSSIQRLTEQPRTKLLCELMQIAEDQFAGRVTRNVTSSLYLLS